MRSRIPLTLLSVTLLALGCQGGERAPEAEEEEVGAVEAAPTLTLAAMNESGVTATADLSHTQDSLSMTLELSGLQAEATYSAHVHRGSCESQGPATVPLGSVTASAEGTGTIQAMVAMSVFMPSEEAAEPAPAGFYVQVHAPDGTPVSCGDIRGPEQTM